jgi:hypothetical protein
VKYLVDRFHQLGVNSITFNTEVSESALKDFFSVMAMAALTLKIMAISSP